jgi:hypothetical protein
VGRDSRRSAGVGRLARRQHQRAYARTQPIPFAGIAFLWFIGVVRDRLGPPEERFFTTVFLRSALLFLGMLFVAAAVVGAMLVAFNDDPAAFASPTLRLARAFSYNLVNIYMVRVAGVFMISTSTVAMSTHFAPRWLAALGYLLAVLLPLGSLSCDGASRSFPCGCFC